MGYSDEDIRRLTMMQAIVRGNLSRNQLMPILLDGFEMLYKCTKRLSDGNMYFVFLLGKMVSRLETAEEPFYLITLRHCSSINDIYDLRINIDMAKKIFGNP